MMVMVMMVVYDNHNLRLRRVGCREAEDKSESKQNLLHASVWRGSNGFTELQ
jgi:hypothetical protein